MIFFLEKICFFFKGWQKLGDSDYISHKLPGHTNGLSYLSLQTMKELVFYLSDAFPASLHDSPISKISWNEIDSLVTTTSVCLFDKGYEGLEDFVHEHFAFGNMKPLVKKKQTPENDFRDLNNQLEELRGSIERFFANLGNLSFMFRERKLFQFPAFQVCFFPNKFLRFFNCES